jgi:protocatechuate 3,4-dioxygenase beta subunit
LTRSPRPYAPPGPGADPEYLHPSYGSTVKRAPHRPLISLQQTLSEVTGPRFDWAGPVADLTRQHKGEPLGERIIVTGRVLDENGRPVPDTLIEIWQCNAAGQVFTNDKGGYRFITIKPGAYPWRNHYNAWRPAHIHFSLVRRSLPSA